MENSGITEESRGKCCFCFRSSSFNSSSQKCAKGNVEDVYKSCVRHINPDYVNEEEFLKWNQLKPLPFCQECLQWTLKLTRMNKQYEKIEKKIVHLVNSFTKVFFKLRDYPSVDVDEIIDKPVLPKSTLPKAPSDKSFDRNLVHVKQEPDVEDFYSSEVEISPDREENPDIDSCEEMQKLLGKNERKNVKIKRKKSLQIHNTSHSKESFQKQFNRSTKNVVIKLTRMMFDSEGNPVPDSHLPDSSPRMKAAMKSKETFSSPVDNLKAKYQSSDKSDSEMSLSQKTVAGDKTGCQEKVQGKCQRRDAKYKCEKCNRSYKRKQHLRDHQKTHDDDNRFECDLCDNVSFAYARTLREHLLRHKDNLIPTENAKPIGPTSAKGIFQCNDDAVSFAHFKNFQQHSLEIHQLHLTDQEENMPVNTFSDSETPILPLDATKIVNKGSTIDPEIKKERKDDVDEFSETEDANFPSTCDEDNRSPPPVEMNPTIEENETVFSGKRKRKTSSRVSKTLRKKQPLPNELNKDSNTHNLRRRKLDSGSNPVPDSNLPPRRKASIKAEETFSSLPDKLLKHTTNDPSDSEMSVSDEISTASGDKDDKTRIKDRIAQRKYRSGYNERYQCQKCHKSYKKKNYLRDHEKTHDEKNRFKCTICHNVSFAYIRSLRNHLFKHKQNLIPKIDKKSIAPLSAKGRFECNICLVSYAYLKNLRQHLLETHQLSMEDQQPNAATTETDNTELTQEKEENETKSFDCKKCDQVFTTYSQRYYHTTVAHKALPSPCDICQMEFENSNKLKRHKRKVHPPNGVRYFCDICNKEFQYASSLKPHMARHKRESNAIGEKSAEEFQCSICNKVLASRGNLNYHMLGHSEVQPFECPQKCGKRFSSKRNMRRHAFVHRGERPFLCEECGKSFPNKGKLTAHKRIHTGLLHYCEFCGKGFQTTTHLKQHHRSHANKNKRNEGDSETVLTIVNNVLNFSKEKPAVVKFFCAICLQAFDAEGMLTEHMKMHDENIGEIESSVTS